MAQGGRNGQEDGSLESLSANFPFGYLPTSLQRDQDHDGAQYTLLNQEQQGIMDNFWSNPDTAPAADDTPYNFAGFGVNDKNGSNSIDNLGFRMSSDGEYGHGVFGNEFNSHVNTAPRAARHMAPPHLSQFDGNRSYDNFFHDNDHLATTSNQQSITHDDLAASTLLSMSSHSQDHPQMAVASDANGGSSWGNISVNNAAAPNGDHFQSPAVSGGPSSSSTTGPITPTYAQHGQRSFQAMPQGGYQSSFMQQPSAYGQQSLARHPSLQLDNTNTHPMYQTQFWQMPQAAPSHDQAQRRPPMIQYGSDHSFSQQGYQSGAYNVSVDKATNLLGVPLVNEASQSARDQSRALAPTSQSGVSQSSHVQRHSLPNNLQQLSNAALSLGQYAPHTPQNQNLQELNPFLQTTTQLPTTTSTNKGKKRRISIDDNDDSAPLAKASRTNGSFGVKQEPSDDHQQQAETGYTTPPVSTNRRRKSSAQAGPSNTAASMTSSSNAPAPSSSRKRRSEPRPPRQNLTEAQKRNNHIASEQKRRDAMKQNYQDLNHLVPSLMNGSHGLARSEILHHAADYLSFLSRGVHAMCESLGVDEDELLREWEAKQEPHHDN